MIKAFDLQKTSLTLVNEIPINLDRNIKSRKGKSKQFEQIIVIYQVMTLMFSPRQNPVAINIF